MSEAPIIRAVGDIATLRRLEALQVAVWGEGDLPDPAENLPERDIRKFYAEAHQRLSNPLTTLSFALVGLATGIATVGFQTVTNNRILTPSVMGLDALYAFIQTLLLFALSNALAALAPGYLGLLLVEGDDLVAMCFTSADFREGVESFLARRPARWTGA